MKKVIAWLLVLALTAAVSIGATLAYLTDTDEDVNVMALGKVKIDQLEYERIDDESQNENAEVQEFHDNKPLYPAVTENGFDYTPGTSYVDWTQIGKDGYTSDIWDPTKINNEVDKMVFVKNKGDYDAYVRTVFAFEAGNYETKDEFLSMVHLNLNDTDWTWEWAEAPVEIGGSKYFIATATYNKVLQPGAYTEISLSQISLDKTATNADVEAFGETYQVLVKSQAIQADGFETAVVALDEGFGTIFTNIGTADAPVLEVNDTAMPFTNDNPVAGIDLKTALHNYEGDTSNVITTKVTNVVFGLNEDYSHIVDEYDGTLVDVEQDVPVYAYYVPNGSNYDIYLLANDTIYTPKDGSGLFRGMTAMKSIDSENLDTGRTEKFTYFLRDCSSLTALDVSGWDVSNTGVANDMYGIFYGCSKLTELTGIEGWDVSNAVDMSNMFRKCTSLTDVSGVENWDVSNVTAMTNMFGGTTSLKTVDLSAWNTESVTHIGSMFRESGITNLDASGWDLRSLVNASQFAALTKNIQNVDLSGWSADAMKDVSYMFYQSNVKSVDTTGWDTASLTYAQCMFYQCGQLEEVIGAQDWETSSIINLFMAFPECYNLKTLDTSTWDLRNVTDMGSTFRNCKSLTKLDVSGWGMDSVTSLYTTFGGCENVEELDVSNWNTGSFKDMTGTFQHCYKLTELDVSNWDTSNVTCLWGTFNACINIETLDVADWDVRNVTNFRMLFQGKDSNAMDMKLTNLDVSKWEPVSAVYMNHMFYGCAQLTEIDLSGWNMPNLYTTSHMFADCINLEVIDVSGWQTTDSWYSMDAMFNDCRSVKYLDVSSFTTTGVVEFSQIFEACWALEEIKGLENWNTANGKSFEQTFLSCGSLKELDLSSWNTHKATNNNKQLNGDVSKGFTSMFSGLNSLTKLTLSADFDFDGDGTVANVAILPNPAKIDGQATKWYNAENGIYYDASEIPAETAATYIAAVPPAENEG